MRLLCPALAALAAAAVVAAAPAALPKPRLALVVTAPVTVRGTHFAHFERVRLSFSAGGDASTRSVRTSGTGAFVAAAPAGFAYSPCGAPLVVTALGAGGDRSALTIPQRECPAP